MAGSNLPDINTLIAAGFDPKTRLPKKLACNLKVEIKKFLRLVDEQDFCNRFVWYNLPCNITSQELERMIYYKGQLCFFYDEELEQFYFMPYSLDGTIDFYGRYNTIHPVPMTNGVEEKDKKKDKKSENPLYTYLKNKKLKVIYGLVDDDTLSNEELGKITVLLHDYTKQLSQDVIPRSDVNDPLLDVMADCIPFMRTALITSTGISGVRVADADQYQSVIDGARSVENAALTGIPWAPIIGGIEFQELTNGATSKAEEYLLAMQSLDNLRLSGYGLDNGGLFQKKAHELQSEADMNGGPVGLVLQDGLSIRQNFCNIVNSIFNLGIWCDVAQNVSGTDLDQDGVLYDENTDGTQTGVENKVGEEYGDTTI